MDTEDLAWSVNRWLREAVLLLRRASSDAGISGQQLGVLGSLEHGRRRMSDLAAEHGVRLPTMTALINRLADAGMVDRTRDETDARVITVGLTPSGHQAMCDGRDQRVRFLSQRLAQLSDTERATIAAALPVLSKLNEHEGD